MEHQFGWLSLLPPLIAIGLAIATRQVILSLLLGVCAGGFLLHPQDPVAAITAICEQHLWKSLADEGHLRVFCFTALMGAMIGVIQHSGGMRDVVRRLAPLARSRRGGQVTTWLLGLIVFIDDYANSLLLGHTMRPLCDRLRISREKLAYLVDSTAAPVSGLALVSTWVAGEIENIEEGLKGLEFAGKAPEAFGLFLATIPYRFYVLWALLLVPIIALSGRDFGPMLRAERDALRGGKNDKPQAASQDRPTDHWINAVAPIVVTVVVTVWLLYATGVASIGQQAGLQDLPAWRRLANIIGNGDSNVSLVYGSLSGLLTALLLVGLQRILSWKAMLDAAGEGARLVAPALAILWLAWALSGLTKQEHLGTGEYLASLLQQSVGPQWMPTIVFVLSFAVAFATGTSWGTMSILMPLVIRATVKLIALSEPVTGDHVLLVASVGGVLAGAIFGDHCSPISDTTVLSSQASGCDHIAHVWTQMPYALLVGVISVVCGTLPVGFGVSVWIALPLGVAAMLGSVWIWGRKA